MKSILRALIVAFLFCIVSMSIVYAEEVDLSYLEKVVVEKGFDTVSITIPPEMVANNDSWEGSIPPVLNDDGSQTLIMTCSEYDDFLFILRESMNEDLRAMSEDESYGFVSIEANEDFSEYSITTAGGELGIADIFGVFGLLINSAVYSVFSGVSFDTVSFTIIDSNTGSVVTSFTNADLAEASFE